MSKTAQLLALAEAATHPVTKGRWMYLPGDRFVYDRLEDGCRGVPQVGVDHAPAFYSDEAKRLQFIAAANPETIRQLVELVRLQHEALRKEASHFFEVPYHITEALEAFNKWEGV